MSLLTLTPEATRLRRIAKACAAGEISRLEYRAARRQMIEKLVGQCSPSDRSSLNDNTVPRFGDEVTQRRDETRFEPVASQPQFRLFWPVLLFLAVLALVMPFWVQAQTTRIPSVEQRDPNPRTSPTFYLDEVIWQVPDDLQSELAGDVEVFLANGLDELKHVNAPGQDGFNRAELEEVGRFLNAIGVHDKDTQLTPGDLADLTALIDQQKKRRGVSLIQLEQLAQRLQTWLRAQGFVLAQAYVPAQTMSDNTVKLEVQLGVLHEVRFADAADSGLGYRLQELKGQYVRRAPLETQLNLLNRLPGIQTEATFSAGDAVGSTNMTLSVKNHKRFSGNISLDNYAPEAVGEERIAVVGHLNNLRGIGDVLSARASSTLDGGDHQSATLGYRTPILAGRVDLAASLSKADIELDQTADFAGDGLLADVEIRDTAVFTRKQRREYVLNAGAHDINWDDVADQRALFVGLGIEGHRLWDAQKVALAGSAQILVGSLDDPRLGQDDNFWRFRATANMWTPFDLPIIDQRTKLVVDAQLQYADDHLPATLRLGATGPNSNRGFSNGRLQLDHGIGINTSLRFDLGVERGWNSQWWTFVDASYGEQESNFAGWSQLTSLGLGWQAQWLVRGADKLISRMTIGYPITQKTSREFEDDGTHLYWSLSYDH